MNDLHDFGMGEIQRDLREIHQIGKRTREYLIHPENCPGLRHHQINLAGISETTPQFRFVNHIARRPQILVGLSGCGRILVNGRWRRCEPGVAYCTPIAAMNAYLGARGFVCGWITYEAAAPWPWIEPVALAINPGPLESILRGLHLEATSRGDATMLEHWAELLQLEGKRILASRSSTRLWRLWLAVGKKLEFPWTLDELASEAGIGPEYLRRLCVAETGVPPMRHVTRLRMQQAVSLLRKGFKVDAVARDVGYENPFAFSTAFKRVIGRPPSSFQS